MTTPTLAPDVLRFVEQHIDSVEQLEMLLLLRIQQDRTWTIPQLAAEMRTSDGSARMRIGGLLAQGFVSRDGDDQYRYTPAHPSVDAAIAAVATAYLIRRYSIIEAILTRSQDNLRVFADAFRFKKGDSDG